MHPPAKEPVKREGLISLNSGVRPSSGFIAGPQAKLFANFARLIVNLSVCLFITCKTLVILISDLDAFRRNRPWAQGISAYVPLDYP